MNEDYDEELGGSMWHKHVFTSIDGIGYNIYFCSPKKELNDAILSVFDEVARSFDLTEGIENED